MQQLKCLYVGLTRARKSVWIVDTSAQAQPLKVTVPPFMIVSRLFITRQTLWKAHGLVEDCSSLDVLPRFARTSAPEEWSDTAKRLFERGHYLQAMHCYARAGMDRERDVSHAYDLRRQARAHPPSELAARNAAFVKAAEAFVLCARTATHTGEVQVYYRIAAQCFLESGEDKRSAECCLLCGDYTQCALCYCKGGAIEDAVHVVTAHGASIEASVVKTVLDVAKVHYLKERQSE